MTPDEILSSAARLLRSGAPLEAFVASLDEETCVELARALNGRSALGGTASLYTAMITPRHSRGSYGGGESRAPLVPRVLGGGG